MTEATKFIKEEKKKKKIFTCNQSENVVLRLWSQMKTFFYQVFSTIFLSLKNVFFRFFKFYFLLKCVFVEVHTNIVVLTFVRLIQIIIKRFLRPIRFVLATYFSVAIDGWRNASLCKSVRAQSHLNSRILDDRSGH